MTKDTYKNIERMLCDGRLMQALNKLRQLLSDIASYELTDRWHGLYRNYGYMLKYFLSGKDDPNREHIQQTMILDAFSLLDDMKFRQYRASGSYQQNKMYDKASQGSDDLLKNTFYKAWLNNEIDDETEFGSTEEILMFLPALTINILQRFSEDKIMVLARYAHSGNEQIRAMALVGWVLVCKKYENRLSLYPLIMEELNLIISGELRENILFVLKCILNTTLTPLVNKEMQSLQNDILPKIKTNGKGRKNGNIVINIDEMEEGNPDWDEEMNDIMGKHYDSMMKLKKEGADFNYSTTKDILSDKFFHEDIANWFIPFQKDNKELNIDWSDEHSKLLKGMLLAMEDACDIDKYAMCRVFYRINDTNIKEHLPSVVNEMASLSDVKEVDKKTEYSFNTAVSQYVKVLYRFFFNNPWQIENELLDAENICATLLFKAACEKQELPVFVDRCISLHLYEQVTQISEPSSAKDWQQLGFAYQKLKEYKNAADAYQKSLLLKESKWTTQHLATMKYYLGEIDVAISLIDKLIAIDAENTDYLKQKAKFLFEANKDEDALQVLFQLQLLLPHDVNIMRSVGWCAFRLAKIDVAEKYLKKVALADDSQASDLLNYAHLLFAKKQRDEALEMYMKALSEYENRGDFISAFVNDLNELRTLNVSQSDILMMEESIIMKLTDETI